MAYSTNYPMGPGFFIFFQDRLHRTPKEYEPPSDRESIIRDDNEILDIITMLVNCDVIF